MSDTPKKSGNRNQGNRSNRRYRNNKSGQGNKSGQNNKRKNFNAKNNNNNRSRNKSRRPKSLTPSRILIKYDNLMEQYLQARKKFFEIFGRGKEKQLAKAQNSYQNALKSLREYESGLKEDWQKDVLKGKIDGLPADRQFTTEHNLEPKGDEVSFVGEFEDPHLLPTQKASDWSKDTEESEGSMNDYYAYKGITPPTPEEIAEKEAKQHRRRH